MNNVTYKQPFKLLVYINGECVGSIKKHPSKELYRYCAHGGGAKGPWLSCVENVKRSIEEA